MKYVFIVNSNAGKGKAAQEFIPKLESYIAAHKELDAEMYLTKFASDAIQYSDKLGASGEEVSIFACGGDGTLYEVLNGAYKYPNVSIGVIPLGSGNDFIRIIGDKEKLQDIDAQVGGTVTEFDLIKAGDKVAINQCSMGFDAEVCANQASSKKLPFVNGEFAYTVSLFYCLLKKFNSYFKVYVDDELVYEGKTIFALCANSRWYGGGYMGAPKAVPDDGLLDCVIVKKGFGRVKLAMRVGEYKRGEHLSWAETVYMNGKKMRIVSTQPASVNVDGECETVTESTFEIIEKGCKFIIPSTSDYFERKKNGKL
ncbi:MAG: hypothetical protein E7514_01640 [Ruminococcaceae bacterium]|nr:hypothetical protein [Oscillospiraceae bacterium]